MREPAIRNVSDTALAVAWYRAQESERPDALFRDPYAARLAGPRGAATAAAMPSPDVGVQILAVRTRIIDDYIREGVAGGVDTVLNLGAGLDSRPYRMELPAELLWIEADFAPMIEYKEAALADQKPQCRLERIKVDLSEHEARKAALTLADARATKMLVLTEGVITYLTEEQVGALADDLHGLAHARYWITEYFSPEFLRLRQKRKFRNKFKNAPLQFSPKDWFGFFAQHGWRPKEIRYIAEEAERWKRPLRLGMGLRMMVAMRTLFASPEQRREFLRFHGHALLEPKP